jgi:hypothetical protein
MKTIKTETGLPMEAFISGAQDAESQNSVQISQKANGKVGIYFEVDMPRTGKDFLQKEIELRDRLNEAGTDVGKLFIESLDVDEPFIVENGVVYRNKGLTGQDYKTFFGDVRVERHTYQADRGGKTICPVEVNASFFLNSTPLLSQVVAYKASEMGSSKVEEDLLHSNGIKLSRRYVKSLSDAVGELAQKKGHWNYEDNPEIDPNKVVTLSLGLDGTTMYLSSQGGHKEAMVGTISAYDEEGDRLHTIYTGASPQHGKAKFLAHLNEEWEKAKKKYPNAFTQGLTDGARWIGRWLKKRTEKQVLDFFHLSEYIGDAGAAIFKEGARELDEYVKYWRHHIKWSHRGAYRFCAELESIRDGEIEMDGLRKTINIEALKPIIVYLKNNGPRTDYLRELENNRPIGSGVTEAACKQLIKARMCQSGMRWKDEGASNIIAIRSLVMTSGRWLQFWTKVMRYGGYARLMGKVGR